MQKQTLELEPVQRVLGLMRSAEFQEAIGRLPGYIVRDAGVAKTVREVFRDG